MANCSCSILDTAGNTEETIGGRSMPDLVKWDPFGELQRVRDDVGRIFGRFFPWDSRGDEFFSGLVLLSST